MQKDVLDSNIDSIKDMVLKKLIDEKNDLIKELETENSLLKRTIIQMDSRFKVLQNQLEVIQESEKRSLLKIPDSSSCRCAHESCRNNINQNIHSQSSRSILTSSGQELNDNKISSNVSLRTRSDHDQNTEIKNESYERMQHESRVMNEIQNIRKEFIEMMKIASSNNSTSPNIIYAGTYGHPYPQMMHQTPQHMPMSVPMHYPGPGQMQGQIPAHPQYIYNSPNNVPFMNNQSHAAALQQTQHSQHWPQPHSYGGSEMGYGSTPFGQPVSRTNPLDPVIDSRVGSESPDLDEAISVKDLLKNSRPNDRSSMSGPSVEGPPSTIGIPPVTRSQIPKAPPMAPGFLSGSNQSGANSNDSSNPTGKNGMDMVILELKSVLNKKRAAKAAKATVVNAQN